VSTFLSEYLTHETRNEAVGRLELVVHDQGRTLAQLAIDWAAKYPRKSIVVAVASRRDQLQSNLGPLTFATHQTRPRPAAQLQGGRMSPRRPQL
jgi:aryl-alcohol dehydrogenase-like predicted oxidoreductase